MPNRISKSQNATEAILFAYKALHHQSHWISTRPKSALYFVSLTKSRRHDHILFICSFYHALRVHYLPNYLNNPDIISLSSLSGYLNSNNYNEVKSLFCFIQKCLQLRTLEINDWLRWMLTNLKKLTTARPFRHVWCVWICLARLLNGNWLSPPAGHETI